MFIAVGENIHCTRIYKVGGAFVKSLDENTHVIAYEEAGQEKQLPVAKRFVESSDWKNGKVKHAAVAMWQGMHGSEAERKAGVEYLHYLVRNQEAHGAAFLDLNVDEFSTDIDERKELIGWAAGVIQEVSTVPLSIDSSNVEILKAGLEACDPAKGSPMVNSVSQERKEAIQVAKSAGAMVIAAATGETSMPTDKQERITNLKTLVALLDQNGFSFSQIYLDPLVFPVSVDPKNGLMILETIEELRSAYGQEIHFAPGLSNISYGMPNRKLINQVFTSLCIQRGLDGGIVDPIQINKSALGDLDPSSESFRLTEAFLTGQDQFGMSYIAAVRQGKI
ncbi:MAG: dihydropteroate synthase [Spirochaetaceae bacterium]|nr:MAG: dihydropteroate synthase [Spirochaetaceae bacterium]